MSVNYIFKCIYFLKITEHFRTKAITQIIMCFSALWSYSLYTNVICFFSIVVLMFLIINQHTVLTNGLNTHKHVFITREDIT